ncbi:MAG: hypothetical protein ACOC6H_03855 [Thermoproteota archaeon]
MQIRTVAAILVLVVVTLLFIYKLMRSAWIFQVSMVLLILALFVYFLPNLTERYKTE